jgi:hypothetical protein
VGLGVGRVEGPPGHKMSAGHSPKTEQELGLPTISAPWVPKPSLRLLHTSYTASGKADTRAVPMGFIYDAQAALSMNKIWRTLLTHEHPDVAQRGQEKPAYRQESMENRLHQCKRGAKATEARCQRALPAGLQGHAQRPSKARAL